MPEKFINPYNFIPFPTEVIRRPVLGHAPTAEQAKQRYVGWFDVTWTLKSPMAIPKTKDWGPFEDRTVRVPGASVKGAVRSVHEALFGGCLRAVDLGFRPVYRDLPVPGLNSGWQLALVTAPDKVWVCDACPGLPLRIDSKVLASSYEDGRPQTGDILRFTTAAVNRANNKIEDLTAPPIRPTSIGEYARRDAVVLVTDRTKQDEPCSWAVGILGSETATIGPTAAREHAWALDNARETGRSGDRIALPADGAMPNTPHYQVEHGGIRRSTARPLEVGDVIWVKLGQDPELGPGADPCVVRIKLSQIWRSRTDGKPLEERLPSTSLVPCLSEKLADSAGCLCLSCTVFGAANSTGKDSRDGEHSAYAGHVRFGPAILKLREREDQPPEKDLAPLGQPHVGAGNFYLESEPIANRGKPVDSADRAARWDAGSEPDDRKLRGRKFYWASQPVAQRAKLKEQGYGGNRFRYLKGDEHSRETSRAALVSEGKKLTQRVWFDGLDAVALHSLLAAFEPRRVLSDRDDYALHLGRGKPLGLGSAVARVNLTQITTVAERYGQNGRSSKVRGRFADPEGERKEEVVSAILDRCGPSLRQKVWPSAEKLLDLNGLGNDAWQVSYPTTESWRDFDGAGFGKSFEWFKTNNGGARKVNGRPEWERGSLTYLPEATADQPINKRRQGGR